jgi:hypothetical protein
MASEAAGEQRCGAFCVIGLLRGRIPLYVKDKYGFLKASAEESLYACQDCYRRVQQAEYDAARKVHVVTLRSLT